jgi:polyribonucleotide nucleotidyltransferase
MGKQIPIQATATIAGQSITLETGKLAALCDGSVVLRFGDTMLLATAVSALEASPTASFFPLSVEYREKFSAAGRIPGNFFRRETKPSDYEVLVCRLVDRVIRPLFPEGYYNETQIFVYLLSGSPETLPDAFAATAASAALMVSDIPFQGPIAEVRVARINGEFVINPSKSQLKEADMDFMIGGSMDSIVMVEGEAQECSEADMLQAIKIAHEAIKEQCQLQLELRRLVGISENRPVATAEVNEELKAFVAEQCQSGLEEICRAGSSKHERKAKFKAIEESLNAALVAKYGEEAAAELSKKAKAYYEDLQWHVVRNIMLTERIRLDGRKPDQIRPIWCEVDYLPSTHGSALFTRGETQSLTTVTLGSKLDEAMIDNAMELSFDRFMLHYNFPPFSTNEAKPVRGTSRREVGHGNLARRSVQRVMPQDYPYTVRIVSDILESNGSSSMATVCAASLALMDAGVPVSSPISGIAMGLVTDGKGNYVVLSDILGDEDHLGDMDFKVTGTHKGICGCQMDIKIDGVDYQLLANALEQARQGRLHILGEMNKVISEAREDLKPHAPRIIKHEIPSDTIGAVIGTGGKVIQAIQARTSTIINIEEANGKGIVTIMGKGLQSTQDALKIIRGITEEPELGEEFEAKIVKVMPYGAFVEYLPSKEGLLHVSELDWVRIENVEDVLKEGEMVRVKYMGIDERTGKSRLSRKALLPKPEGYVEAAPQERRSGGGGGYGGHGGGGNKGGHGGGNNRDRGRR